MAETDNVTPTKIRGPRDEYPSVLNAKRNESWPAGEVVTEDRAEQIGRDNRHSSSSFRRDWSVIRDAAVHNVFQGGEVHKMHNGWPAKKHFLALRLESEKDSFTPAHGLKHNSLFQRQADYLIKHGIFTECTGIPVVYWRNLDKNRRKLDVNETPAMIQSYLDGDLSGLTRNNKKKFLEARKASVEAAVTLDMVDVPRRDNKGREVDPLHPPYPAPRLGGLKATMTSGSDQEESDEFSKQKPVVKQEPSSGAASDNMGTILQQPDEEMSNVAPTDNTASAGSSPDTTPPTQGSEEVLNVAPQIDRRSLGSAQPPSANAEIAQPSSANAESAQSSTPSSAVPGVTQSRKKNTQPIANSKHTQSKPHAGNTLSYQPPKFADQDSADMFSVRICLMRIARRAVVKKLKEEAAKTQPPVQTQPAVQVRPQQDVSLAREIAMMAQKRFKELMDRLSPLDNEGVRSMMPKLGEVIDCSRDDMEQTAERMMNKIKKAEENLAEDEKQAVEAAKNMASQSVSKKNDQDILNKTMGNIDATMGFAAQIAAPKLLNTPQPEHTMGVVPAKRDSPEHDQQALGKQEAVYKRPRTAFEREPTQEDSVGTQASPLPQPGPTLEVGKALLVKLSMKPGVPDESLVPQVAPQEARSIYTAGDQSATQTEMLNNPLAHQFEQEQSVRWGFALRKPNPEHAATLRAATSQPRSAVHESEDVNLSQLPAAETSSGDGEHTTINAEPGLVQADPSSAEAVATAVHKPTSSDLQSDDSIPPAQEQNKEGPLPVNEEHKDEEHKDEGHQVLTASSILPE